MNGRRSFNGNSIGRRNKIERDSSPGMTWNPAWIDVVLRQTLSPLSPDGRPERVFLHGKPEEDTVDGRRRFVGPEADNEEPRYNSITIRRDRRVLNIIRYCTIII